MSHVLDPGPQGFVPPPYPYERLAPLKELAGAIEGGVVDLSIGTPNDPPPAAVVEALGSSGTERGYPPSIGTPALRDAAAAWLDRRLGVAVDPATEVAATIGSKELVAGIPHWLHLRDPSRDTVLYPSISYPSYAMGATLAGVRAVPVPMDDDWSIDLSAIPDHIAPRVLCLWVNSPGNPAGGLDDLQAAADWGRTHGVPVLSDECYVEFTWDGPPRTILGSGTDGVLAVHSLSKRSNLAGARVGFYAGDPELVGYLGEVRKHAGFMCPGPSQAAGAAALGDDAHVEVQRDRYHRRLEALVEVLGALGVEATMPRGGFYLFPSDPAGGWALAERLARDVGILASPGEFYGPAGDRHVRLAVVAPDEAYGLLAERAARLG